MIALRWEDPPEPLRKGGHVPGRREYLRQVAEALRSRRGEWAVISTMTDKDDKVHAAVRLSINIRMGHLAPFRPAGDFEAVARTVDGEARVYARYLGDGEL